MADSNKSLSDNLGLQSDLEEFAEGNNKTFYHELSYYNPDHRRIGNNDAEIVDFVVSADGNIQFDLLEGDETLVIYLKVKFNRDVDKPQVGLGIVSPEGIVIAESNTQLKKILLPSAEDGETCIYSIEIKPQLSGGQYFLNAAVGRVDNEIWTHLDTRRSLIHLAVAQSEQYTGFFEIPHNFAVLR